MTNQAVWADTSPVAPTQAKSWDSRKAKAKDVTSDNAAGHKQTLHTHTWQTLSEFTLAGEPGSEQLAIDHLTAAVQELNLPASLLGQIKRALAKAIRDVIARSHLSGSGAMPIIRALVPEGEDVAPETDRRSETPGHSRGLSNAIQQILRPPSRGWGFFLIEKAMPGPNRGDLRYLIELFLYPEGTRRDRQRD